MNYIPIHTNIAPNYNYLSAENAFLKQSIEYKDAVIVEQAATVTALRPGSYLDHFEHVLEMVFDRLPAIATRLARPLNHWQEVPVFRILQHLPQLAG